MEEAADDDDDGDDENDDVSSHCDGEDDNDNENEDEDEDEGDDGNGDVDCDGDGHGKNNYDKNDDDDEITLPYIYSSHTTRRKLTHTSPPPFSGTPISCASCFPLRPWQEVLRGTSAPHLAIGSGLRAAHWSERPLPSGSVVVARWGHNGVFPFNGGSQS